MSTTFRFGEIEIEAVSDGILKTNIDTVKDMAREKARALVNGPTDGVYLMPVNNFVFRNGQNTVLIDAGCGDTVQPTLGRLVANLHTAGIEPEDVTHIVITHLHVDHANGLVDNDGAAIYPNAEILIHDEEYAFWLEGDGAGSTEILRRKRERNLFNMKPYLERTRRLRDGQETAGCSPVLAAGHSPGHSCWRIGTGRRAFMALGDLVHIGAIQISHPEVNLTYDLEQDRARASRRRMLDIIAADGLAIAGSHIDAPGVGRIVRSGSAFAYEAE